jgi:pyroglutamyl-peptidase
MEHAPRLLVTGFGPFPGAAANPTAALIEDLRGECPGSLAASALRAAVLPTDYRKSWPILRRLIGRFEPNVIVHFGLSRRAEAVHVERLARKACRSDLLDAVGFAPPSGLVCRAGPESLVSTLPVNAIVAMLRREGIPAAISEDAGAYVCNATLYRSLRAAPAGRMVGFVHVPPVGQGGFDAARLSEAARLIASLACRLWPGPNVLAGPHSGAV